MRPSGLNRRVIQLDQTNLLCCKLIDKSISFFNFNFVNSNFLGRNKFSYFSTISTFSWNFNDIFYDFGFIFDDSTWIATFLWSFWGFRLAISVDFSNFSISSTSLWNFQRNFDDFGLIFDNSTWISRFLWSFWGFWLAIWMNFSNFSMISTEFRHFGKFSMKFWCFWFHFRWFHFNFGIFMVICGDIPNDDKKKNRFFFLISILSIRIFYAGRWRWRGGGRRRGMDRNTDQQPGKICPLLQQRREESRN